jgi:prepilin-type N-terminal cleavage/methylation domain-containing protein
MHSLNKQNRGFTIIELLVVIVVIGLLAALVLNSFQGVQGRARDTERRTDVNAIATQLEVYYQDNGRYPDVGSVTIDGIAKDAWITANIKSASLDAFRAPGQTSNTIIPATGTQTKDNYMYTIKDAAGTVCTTVGCAAKFSLSYKEENGAGVVKSRNSLN